MLDKNIKEQCPPCPVEAAPAAEVRKKVSVVPLHEGIPCVFGIDSGQLAAQADGNDFRIRQPGIQNMPSLGYFWRCIAAIQLIDDDIDC